MTVEGTKPARLLRVGDRILCRHWSGLHWCGGDPEEIATFGRKGTRVLLDLRSGRQLDLAPDDPVLLLDREVPASRRGRDLPAVAARISSEPTKKVKQPRRGQLKLF